MNDEPQTIAASDVPYRLLETTTTTTTTTVPSPVEVKKPIYLVRQVAGANKLAMVERSFEASNSDLREVLRVLISGAVSQDELDQGLSSAIPEGAEFLGMELDEASGVLTVQVSGIFEELQGDGVRLALAQIVYTATAEVARAVTFEDGSGAVVEALIDGNQSDAVVNRSDYRSLAP